jgi:drug/metabolite transporter (DMT)-like permease
MIGKSKVKFILLGVLFAIFWSSASTAVKFGLRSVEPLFLFQCRFFLAGVLMLLYGYTIEKSRLPNRTELKQLAIFGFLNVTLYLGLFVLGISQVAAGIGSLAVSLNPLIMMILSAVFLGKKVKPRNVIVLFIGIVGCGVAVYPLFENAYATPLGVTYLGISMLSYSVAAIYFSSINWKLSRTVVNGWQVFVGGIFLLPFTYLLNDGVNTLDLKFTLSLLWLTVPVSVIAVSLWLWLLKQDTTKASYFLFLCPIFGFTYASFFLGEPFTIYTFCGLVLVLGALGLGQQRGG